MMKAESNATYCPTSVNPLPARHQAVRRDRTWSVGCQNVLFYFMDRFTCSHCWKVAVQLARQQALFENRHVKVVLVGGGKYGHEAARLAQDLGLPFPIIADGSATLKRSYLSDSRLQGHGSLVLVDYNGRPLIRQTIASPAQFLDLDQFLANAGSASYA